MTFELFSDMDPSTAGKSLSTPMPYKEDLYVRFLFRNGTEPESPFISYPLFGRGNSENVMPWADFVEGMGSFSMDDMVEWCRSCNSITLFYEALNEKTGNWTSGEGIVGLGASAAACLLLLEASSARPSLLLRSSSPRCWLAAGWFRH
ncbi:hypothetical protein DL98DRAFT_597735 [Cadophora sp. DSE1049]|nr:hypothetical protein DL98DRAFT_597735 [Cadophora sp. DSE1049]